MSFPNPMISETVGIGLWVGQNVTETYIPRKRKIA